ncbi:MULTISPECIES: cytochrome bc complex cytochrome b subunit [Micromonospora]|uniref:Cytochrome bc1 complex cytochrome b subunit n=1 Tax=Micromonospora solifontis TaxID=2487138 RepID=A0ABX9W9F1_9ACTN|nr:MULTISPECIES: cytochrome bc complex cytochrome b subunit [Micromonospora]NES16923.1 cytochrome bc complex cytochrome b subunit [Micromonospora sp. PPF5-17B]NES39336.1 cytochrome bc complex cytochrome b subunit [Micromonospora solifontis]NES58601.1 cytochrome bc complex cytochrome b subunit [Micromonospora sp. PPF5-6]RNL89433.1 cytochrome bc complex cytochrome b subunit [Micromonospora solifontis]
MILDRLARAVDDRLRLSPLTRKALAKVFPDHWSFMLGEIALYSFVALILTGVYLTLFFDASSADRVYHGAYAPLDGTTTSAAYASTVRLSWDVRAGLLIRQTHHWSALIFVAAILVHLVRIFFTGAFRKPRELNWLVGVTMLLLALANGFTGYSMPDDLLSGLGLRIIVSVVESVPLVGSWLVALGLGGEFPSDEMIPRLFVTHVLLVPAVLVALVSVHLAMVVRQKHSQFPGPGRTEHNVVGARFYPNYTLRSVALFLWVLAVLFALGGLVQINPVWLYGPFAPAQSTSPAQPDWYVAWGDGALRLFPPWEIHIAGHLVPAPFFPGVVLGGVTFLALYAWPFLERWCGGDRRAHQLLDRPRDHPVRMGVGVMALTFFAVLVVTAGDDILARLLRVPVYDLLNLLRVLVLVLPVLAGALAFLLARALRRGDAARLGELTRADLRAARQPADRGDAEAAADEPELPAPDRPGERVELWPDGDVWRWRYRDEPAGVAILSNRAVLTEQEAAESARLAYPGVDHVLVPGPPPPPLPGRVRTALRRWGNRALGVSLLVAALRQRRDRRRGGHGDGPDRR